MKRRLSRVCGNFCRRGFMSKRNIVLDYACASMHEWMHMCVDACWASTCCIHVCVHACNCQYFSTNATADYYIGQAKMEIISQQLRFINEQLSVKTVLSHTGERAIRNSAVQLYCGQVRRKLVFLELVTLWGPLSALTMLCFRLLTDDWA